MTHRPFSPILLLITTILAASALPARALEPADVAVIYNTASKDSRDLAQYYINARHIPETNLIPITYAVSHPVGESEQQFLLAKENISEADYRGVIVPQIRREITAKHLEKSLKCLVTTYDVPLKIGAVYPDQPTAQEIAGDNNQLNNTLKAMEHAVADYNHIAAVSPTQPAPTQPATTAPQPPKKPPTLNEELNILKKAATEAVQRLNNLPPQDRPAAMAELVRVHETVTGLNGVLTTFAMKGDGPDAEKSWELRDQKQAELNDLVKRLTELNQHRTTPAAREQAVTLAARAFGLVGKARELEENTGFLTETESCFDNELTLVLADQNYPRGRWIPNPQNIEFYPRFLKFTDIPKTLLVTRIDGSTVAKAQAMIDLGLKIEKIGLNGKMYLDSRGRYNPTDPYSSLDIQLRQLAQWMKANTTMDVILDERDARFQAKDCPDCALYCGWYSLRHYEDACQWLPGAVGYHVASGEMESLHRTGESGWVVNLLNRGFCGTLGPTDEPYLTAFPNPYYFFTLLLSGEFTQGEVWQVTAPMLSWRNGYVGDPLYNPFKSTPRVKPSVLEQDPILRNAFVILRPEMPLDPLHQPASQPTPIVIPPK